MNNITINNTSSISQFIVSSTPSEILATTTTTSTHEKPVLVSNQTTQVDTTTNDDPIQIALALMHQRRLTTKIRPPVPSFNAISVEDKDITPSNTDTKVKSGVDVNNSVKLPGLDVYDDEEDED